MKLYEKLASTLMARDNYVMSTQHNSEWYDKHTETIRILCKEKLPSGAGFDCGTMLDLELSKPEKLVFKSSFHCMNDNGYYTKWIHFKIVVKASLVFGITITIKGDFSHSRDLKCYIHEVFDTCLNMEIK